MGNQKHHFVPLGIQGINHKVNIVTLSEKDHQLVHQTCNYPYRVFTDMWRTFRRRHNGKCCWDEAMVDDILRMQEGYLCKYVNLPPHLQRMHFQKMNELCRYYNENHVTQRTWSKLWYEYCQSFRNYHLG